MVLPSAIVTRVAESGVCRNCNCSQLLKRYGFSFPFIAVSSQIGKFIDSEKEFRLILAGILKRLPQAGELHPGEAFPGPDPVRRGAFHRIIMQPVGTPQQ